MIGMCGQARAVAVLSFVAVVAVTAAVALVAADAPLLGLGGIVLVATLGWVVMPRAADALPRRLVLLLTAFTLSSLLPTNARTLVELLMLVGTYLEWLGVPPKDRRGARVVGWCTAIFVAWALLMFHPNVPDLGAGALGFRKSVLALGGIVLGCAIRHHMRWRAERFVIWLLTGALVISIAAHLWFPSIEQVVSRQADQYTGMFGGEARLQGIFAGPFHAAIAAVLLIGWALFRLREKPAMALLVGAVGVVAVQLAMVRTAYVAIAVIALTLVLASPSASGCLTRLSGLLMLGGIVAAALRFNDEAATVASSIGSYGSDRRFLNRLPEYQQGIDMFTRSPIWGWGSGSAGDTLGDEFGAGHEHVTPHNLLLKFAVEGGLIGLFCILGLAIATLRQMDRRIKHAQLALMAASGLIAMGTTGSAIETLPVSYLLLVLVGLGVGLEREPDEDLATSDDVSEGASRLG